MIAKLLAGMARSLFLLGCGLLVVAFFSFYGAWRLARAALVGAKPMPVREASLATMMAAANLVRAVMAQASAGTVEADEDAAPFAAPEAVGGGRVVRVDVGGQEFAGGHEDPDSAFAATSDALPS